MRTNLDFSKALVALKENNRIFRADWNDKDSYVELQQPDLFSKMTEPYMYLVHNDDRKIPWVPSQSDILANDWGVR